METIIRKLARSHDCQFLYVRAKELKLKIFNNDSNLTKAQLIFLQWLHIYSSLYECIMRKEKYINEEVIEDDLRCDSYLLWRRKNKDKKDKPIQTKKNGIDMTGGIPTVIFKRK